MSEQEQKLPYPTDDDVREERAFWFSDTLTKAHQHKRSTVLLIRRLYKMLADRSAAEEK